MRPSRHRLPLLTCPGRLTLRKFTAADVTNEHLYVDRADLVEEPLPWQTAGLQQTASGYGAKLTMPYKIHYEGKLYRLYCTQYSNVGTVWFKVKGKTIYVS